MRKDFNIENSLEKEVVLTIRVPKSFDEHMERRIDEALSDVLFDLGCELINSEEFRDVSVPDIQHVNMDMLKFRDYDDTDIPLQFFYGLEAPKEQMQALVSLWGYKGSLCRDVEICLDIYSLEECSVEAVLTFEDDEQRWVDLRSKPDCLGKLIPLVEAAGTECAQEAMELYKEFKPSLESQIHSASIYAAETRSADNAPGKETTFDLSDCELSPDEAKLYQTALEHFALDANGIEYIEGISPRKLIYCYENNHDLMDFDFWCRFEDLCGEKLTFDEFLAINKTYDGDPFDVEETDVQLIASFKKTLEAFRSSCGSGRPNAEVNCEDKKSLHNVIQSASDSKVQQHVSVETPIGEIYVGITQLDPDYPGIYVDLKGQNVNAQFEKDTVALAVVEFNPEKKNIQTLVWQDANQEDYTFAVEYENLVAAPSLSGQIQSASTRASEAHSNDKTPVKEPNFER